MRVITIVSLDDRPRHLLSPRHHARRALRVSMRVYYAGHGAVRGLSTFLSSSFFSSL